MRVAVIGGGISGLSAALELEKARAAGQAVDYVLFEKQANLGGCIQSEQIDGCIIEGGPDSFLTEKPAAAKLCQELGIGQELTGSDDTSRKTYILLRNRLITLPDGLMFMVPTKLIPTAISPLFSVGTKLRMALELIHPPKPAAQDESVEAFVTRHFGNELVHTLVSPLLSGIYGGSASKLSVRAVLPKMVDMETQYGSLTRGMLAARKKMAQFAKQAPNGRKKPTLFTSLRGGMGQMIRTLQQNLSPERIRLNCGVHSLEQRKDGWRITTDQGAESFDGVILALPAWASGALLQNVDRELGEELSAIQYSSSITVTFLFKNSDVEPLPPGFGFLVPDTEDLTMMACTFSHRKFPRPGTEGKAILRCFIGGERAGELLQKDGSELEILMRAELKKVLGITANPENVRISRWDKTMSQYTVGHKERIARIQARMEKFQGLALAGNGYDGIGVPDCIRLGKQASTEMLKLEALSKAHN